MFLKASADYDQVVNSAEACLSKLYFEFQRNGKADLAEFEIIHPAYFRIVIEPDKMPKTRNLLMPSISPPKGSTIEIRFGLDDTGQTEASKLARYFLRELIKTLPEKPWNGLGSRESAKEEKRWKEQIEERAQ